MLYTKPELVALGCAVEVIQGTEKNCPNYVDIACFELTIGAYEADE